MTLKTVYFDDASNAIIPSGTTVAVLTIVTQAESLVRHYQRIGDAFEVVANTNLGNVTEIRLSRFVIP